jgi:ABC-type multidrug transport system fused ATPase/permease subunit
VFDEFTAHLDPDTERDIVTAMARLTADRTALVIAHRDATMALADRVLVLDDEMRTRSRP